MKKLILLVLFLGLIVVNSSCAYKEIAQNKDNAAKLRINMSKSQVLEIMGEPLENQKNATENRWFYVDSVKSFDGYYTQDECMILVFENDKLIGFGKEFNAKHSFKKPTQSTQKAEKFDEEAYFSED